MTKGKDYLKPGTAEFYARQARWRHNSLLGSLGMARQFVRDVETLSSTTSEAKALAVEIEGLLDLLGTKLKTRIDQK